LPLLTQLQIITVNITYVSMSQMQLKHDTD